MLLFTLTVEAVKGVDPGRWNLEWAVGPVAAGRSPSVAVTQDEAQFGYEALFVLPDVASKERRVLRLVAARDGEEGSSLQIDLAAHTPAAPQSVSCQRATLRMAGSSGPLVRLGVQCRVLDLPADPSVPAAEVEENATLMAEVAVLRRGLSLAKEQLRAQAAREAEVRRELASVRRIEPATHPRAADERGAADVPSSCGTVRLESQLLEVHAAAALFRERAASLQQRLREELEAHAATQTKLREVQGIVAALRGKPL